MKTTLDLPDALLNEAQRIAQENGLTLAALVEDALRQTVEARQLREPFRLGKHPFGGQGLHPDLRNAEWSEIRRRAYEDPAG